MSFLVYCDESVSKGKYYSNFYGGLIVRAAHADRLNQLLTVAANEAGLHKEIKWSKVSAGPYLDKYKTLMDHFFHYVATGHIRIRLFFRKNSYETTGLSLEQRERRFTLLYYQFLKHSFGFNVYRSDDEEKAPIGLRLDLLPDKKEHVRDFKAHLGRLSFNHCYINKDDIAEVDSKKHLLLQCLDVVLGSVAFRLNDLHKEKPPGAVRRGKKTIAKEKLYKHIQRQVQELYSSKHPRFYNRQFNMGDSTGIGYVSEPWDGPFRLWSFIPANFVYVPGRSKE